MMIYAVCSEGSPKLFAYKVYFRLSAVPQYGIIACIFNSITLFAFAAICVCHHKTCAAQYNENQVINTLFAKCLGQGQ